MESLIVSFYFFFLKGNQLKSYDYNLNDNLGLGAKKDMRLAGLGKPAKSH